MLAEDCAAAGMPAGVFNVVTGTGPVAGEALMGHDSVRMISLHGLHRGGSPGGQSPPASNGSILNSVARRPWCSMMRTWRRRSTAPWLEV